MLARAVVARVPGDPALLGMRHQQLQRFDDLLVAPGQPDAQQMLASTAVHLEIDAVAVRILPKLYRMRLLSTAHVVHVRPLSSTLEMHGPRQPAQIPRVRRGVVHQRRRQSGVKSVKPGRTGSDKPSSWGDGMSASAGKSSNE